jgi:hypothetical protein
MGDALLMQMLTTLGYALPELLASGVALAMLWSSAQPGRPRELGLWGVGLMLLCALLQLGVGVYQTWMINNLQGDSSAALGRMFSMLGILRLLINCLSLTGLVIVVWGLCSATCATRAAPPAV